MQRFGTTVFPAHAGMNRYQPARYKIDLCVPRACGDEPNDDFGMVDLDFVFPAHAGMNRNFNLFPTFSNSHQTPLNPTSPQSQQRKPRQ